MNIKLKVILLFLLFSSLKMVKASTISDITLEVYPISGDISSEIIARVRGVPFNGGFGTSSQEYPVLYIYFDDKIIESRIPPIIRDKGYGDFDNYEASWDIVIKVPNEFPYSELGVHVIKAKVEASDGSTASETTSFTVVNYIPPPDWWEDLPEEFVESIKGSRGAQGPVGEQGPPGVPGIAGDVGAPGEPYPREALYYTVGASTFALILSVYIMIKTRK